MKKCPKTLYVYVQVTKPSSCHSNYDFGPLGTKEDAGVIIIEQPSQHKVEVGLDEWGQKTTGF